MLMTSRRLPSKIVDVERGRLVRSIEADRPPIGWDDDSTVVRLAPGSADHPVLELIDITTGETIKRVSAPGLPQPALIQIGSADGLSGDAAELGF
jgi:hypothetical protein